MGARREQSRHSNKFLKPPNNSLIYPAAPRSVWCREAGFFYIQAECSEAEATVRTTDIKVK